MFQNYLKIALRNFRKQKISTLITVLGLSIGMTCCLLIYTYVQHELSYDRFHRNANRIYRLVVDVKTPTETIPAAITGYGMGPDLQRDFPEVQHAVRVQNDNFLVERNGQAYYEDNAAMADSAFFEVFSFPLLRGNPQTALSEPYSVVLSEDAARKYFGDEDPMGQTLKLDGAYQVTVTGISRNTPENSHIQFSMLVSMRTLTEKLFPGLDEIWGSFNAYSYLLLKEGTDAKALEAKFPDFVERHNGPLREDDMSYSLFLEPLTRVYLHSDRSAPRSGNITNVYVFSVIAVFILLIAGINFMNLAVARSLERAKEVGIRKVIGAVRTQLAVQFLAEFMLLSLLAFLLAIGLAELLLPAFNELSGKIISESIIRQPDTWGMFLLLAPVVGVLAGIYPALILSGFQPVSVLKGRFSSSSRGLVLRKVLVVCQFTISVTLIAGTIVVYQQLHFLRNQPLGFQKEQMLIVNFRGDTQVKKQYETIKRELAGIPGVVSASASSSRPGTGNSAAYTQIQTRSGEMQATNMDLYSIDYDFLEQYRVPVVAGRAFSREFATDSTQALIVNEAVVRVLGYTSPEEIIGKRFSQWGREGQIIGVIRNFHFRSLRENVKPLTLRVEPNDLNLFSLNVKTDNLPATLAQLESKWQQLVPQRPIEHAFLDEAFNQQYQGEERFGELFLYFSGLAIFIACLGLLGLTSYTTAQRTREIGIRKVLGATTGNITLLLSKDFIRLVVIAFIIALPLSWYVMTEWLSNFEYRVGLSWWMFALAGILAIAIAFLTISVQSIKAALANPVKSLRSE